MMKRTPRALLVLLAFQSVAASSALGLTGETCPGPRIDSQEYCLVTRPFSVATGDLDGDGNLDLVVGRNRDFQRLAQSILVLFGRGDSTFGDMASYEGGALVTAVAIGDLNGDCHLDLVALDEGARGEEGQFTIFLNGGDGKLFDHMTHRLGRDPRSLALGDLDDDGDLDMAVTGDGAVATFRNNGDGTFVFFESYPADLSFGIAIGDLNGDGALDFVTANWFQGVVWVRFNNGDGTFGSVHAYDCGALPSAVAIGDLDGDDDADLVVTNAGHANDIGRTVSVLRNSGDGTFFARVPLDVGDIPWSVRLADLDGDDDLDLAVGNHWTDDVSVLINHGDASFAPEIRSSAGSGPYALTSGDFNSDGESDLAVVNMFGNTLSVLANLGDGVFGDDVQYDVGVKPVAVAIGDLDGDGALDLAVTNRVGGRSVDGTISLLLNLGDGSFKEQVVLDTGNGPEGIVIGDLDGDDDLDLAVSNINDDGVAVHLNNGDGTFADPITYSTGSSSSPIALAIGDLDDDDDLDLAVANAESESVSILLNRGNGTFADHVTYHVGGVDVSLPYSIALGDVDGDGDLDFATVNLEASNFSVFRNNGDGTFGDEVTYPIPHPEGIAFGDLDGDKDLDLIIASAGFVWISLNDGNGNFGPTTYYRSCFGAFFVTTGDLDGDGDLDVVVSDVSHAAGFLPNNGDATFGEPVFFRLGSGAHEVAVGDLNGDGALDLAAPNFEDDTVSVVLSHSTIRNGDMDDDGDVDLTDFALLAMCLDGPDQPPAKTCPPDVDADLDCDGDVDVRDYAALQEAFEGD